MIKKRQELKICNKIVLHWLVVFCWLEIRDWLEVKLKYCLNLLLISVIVLYVGLGAVDVIRVQLGLIPAEGMILYRCQCSWATSCKFVCYNLAFLFCSFVTSELAIFVSRIVETDSMTARLTTSRVNFLARLYGRRMQWYFQWRRKNTPRLCLISASQNILIGNFDRCQFVLVHECMRYFAL